MSKAAKNIGLLGLFTPLAIGAWFWGGYVTSVLWSWFLSEPFGIFQISPLQAMGIGCVTVCFTWSFARSSQIKDPHDRQETAWVRAFGGVFQGYVSPAVFLLAGWVLRQIG